MKQTYQQRMESQRRCPATPVAAEVLRGISHLLWGATRDLVTKKVNKLVEIRGPITYLIAKDRRRVVHSRSQCVERDTP